MYGMLPEFRALVAAFLLCASGVSAQTDAQIAAYGQAVAAMRSGDWSSARASAERAGPVARDVLEWHRLRAGGGSLSDALSFLERRADWPGLALLRRKMEDKLPIGGSPETVFAFFGGAEPETGYGTRALIAAHRANGDVQKAEDMAVLAWRTQTLSVEDERKLLAVYGPALRAHHTARLDMLLWRGAREGAKRQMHRVDAGWQALAEARMALRANAAGVDTLIEKVPAALQADPGLAFERMQWRARKGLDADAMALIYAASPGTLGEPEYWAGWRRVFARFEMRAGRIENAYELAANHGLTEGSNFADLEWLAGYIALTYKKDGAKALEHFKRFRGGVETPISLGRAGYWEGRAYEALGDAENAELAYRFGAEYQTSFYGLLAAERAGIPLDPRLTGDGPHADWRLSPLAGNSVFQAARMMIAAGERNLAEQFLRHLTETLPEDQIGSLGDFLLSQDESHLAVMVGKEAAQRGIVVPAAYFPAPRLGVALPVAEELALAIARRESEFDPLVTSGAGARGLMQLMPATAKAVAASLQIRYESDRLLTDPAYNARLGTAYLDELMEIFDGNVLMTAAGYNAGPGRPIRWMKERGDPRQGEIDVVDWIEHIPFDETRNYVMRVTESLPVYRARLTGAVGLPVTLTDELTARPGHVRTAMLGDFVRPRPRPATPSTVLTTSGGAATEPAETAPPARAIEASDDTGPAAVPSPQIPLKRPAARPVRATADNSDPQRVDG
jgi:soluble lytic murein transglycosylase